MSRHARDVLVVPLVQAVVAACASDLARNAPRRVRPTALLVSATPPLGPDGLLEEAVRITPAVHPYAATWLDHHGRRLDAWTWSVSNSALSTALSVFDEALVLEEPSSAMACVVVTTRPRRSKIRIVAESSVSLLRYDDAEDLIVTTDLQVFDASSGALAAWTRLRESSVVARCQPGSPNLARLVDGRRLEQILSASAAVKSIDAASHGSVACDPIVASLADLTNAPAVMDSVLLDPQQRVVGRYLQSRDGIVCALPPGSGKTVVAARALHHAPGVSVVVAPAGLEVQWRAELTKFAPALAVVSLRRGEELIIPANKEAFVVITTPRSMDAVRLAHIDHLIIDEAAFLGRWSKQTSAAWDLRSKSAKTLLLTGTPARKKVADLGGLVSFVLNNRREFQGVPLGDDWQDRVGPLVSGVDDVSVLPASSRHLVRCSPSPAEVALLTSSALALTTARAELARAEAAGAAGAERNRLRYLAQAAFDRARLAGTDPAGVTGEGAALAVGIVAPSKRTALAQLCADGVTTVVCCDSAVIAQAVAAALQDSGVAAAALTGALSRDAQSRTAGMLGNGIDVLVTAAVGQMGWNLHAASRVVHYDVPLTAAAARQREGRVRRIGAASSTAVCLLLEGAVDTDAALAWAADSVDNSGL